MAKIQMKTPLVEMDGDEMTRIIWQDIKDILLTPYIDLKTEYYDLGLVHRNETDDQVTVDSANATKKYGVAVKCATITPNAARMPEYNLKEMWKSPNGTIRAILDGTVFRTPILVKGITPYIPTWTKPITIARHAYGDVYKNVEMKCPAGSKAELVCTDKDGKETRETLNATESFRVSTTSQLLSLHSQELALTLLLTKSRTYGSLQRILSQRNMTTHSRTFSRRYTTTSTRLSLKRLVSSISILLSTTLLRELFAQTAVISGPARTMTVT